MTAKPKNGILYCRVSSTKQKEYGTSLEAQERLLIDFATIHDISVEKIFKIDETGTVFQRRKSIMDVLYYIRKKKGKITHVLATKIDRVSRADALEFYWFKGELDAENVKLITASEYLGEEETPETEFIEGVNVARARFDRNNIVRETTRGSVRKLKEKAFWVSGTPPLGYMKEAITKRSEARCIPDPERYDKIVQLWNLAVTGEYSLAELIKEAKKINLKSRSGKMLSRQVISILFRNKFYCGILSVKNRKSKYADYTITQEGEWSRYKMVTEQQFMAVQHLLNKKAHSKGIKKAKVNNEFSLSKILKCEHCDRIMSGYTTKGHRYYRCNACKNNKRADKVEEAFYVMLEAFIPSTEFIDIFIDEMKQRFDNKYKDQVDLKKQYADQIKLLERKKEKIKAGYLEGLYDIADAKTKADEVSQEIAYIQELSTACDVDNHLKPQYVEKAYKFIEHLPSVWKTASGSNRCRLAEVLFPKGVIYKDNTLSNQQNTAFFRDLFDIEKVNASMVRLTCQLSNFI
jgi:site-specific DNA recombinase